VVVVVVVVVFGAIGSERNDLVVVAKRREV